MPERDKIDDEAFAALIDGKVSRRRRKALLAHLVVADEDREMFADTAALVREMEDEDQAASSIPGGATSRLGRLGQLLLRLGAAIRFRR
jgi:hypothetical protein